MKALNDWVIIRAVKPEKVGNILVPGTARHINAEFFVHDIGPEVDLEKVPIAVGDKIATPDAWSGTAIDRPDEYTEYLAARASDLVAVL